MPTLKTPRWKILRFAAIPPALACLCLILGVSARAAEKASRPPATYTTEMDISYLSDFTVRRADAYQKRQCRIDLYLPTNRPGFPTIVWFHGGGLTTGRRTLPDVKDQEIALVAVGTRLSPEGPFPSFLEDAAAAVAWTIRNIAPRGGDPGKIFVGGKSAGGYLAAMVGMDPRWLAAHGLSNRILAGLIPVSGQVSTHFQVKKLRNDSGPELRVIVDEYAPLYYAAKDVPPICLITGDRALEYKNRVEENQLLAVSLRNLGHPWVEFYEMGGLNHGAVTRGSALLIPGFVKKVVQHIDETKSGAVRR
jgi:acetyl esterase/lipase